MKGEEGAAPVLTAERGCRGGRRLWRGGQMLVRREPAVAICRSWRGLAWATEERAGKSCGGSGGELRGRTAGPLPGQDCLQMLDSMGRGLCFL